MGVDDLYPLWLANGHDELAEHVSRMQRGYDSLVHKDSTYGRSIKGILDLRIQMLAVWDAAPKALPPNEGWGGMLLPFTVETTDDGYTFWNPLTDDGDALRLAVSLGLIDGGITYFRYRSEEISNGLDPFQATRRAIVRAAAEIGKSK